TVFVLAVGFANLLSAELDLYGKELTVLFQDAFETPLVQELLGIFVDMKDNVRAPLCFFGGSQFKFRRSVANPMGRFVFAGRVGSRDNFDLVGDHERGIKA